MAGFKAVTEHLIAVENQQDTDDTFVATDETNKTFVMKIHPITCLALIEQYRVIYSQNRQNMFNRFIKELIRWTSVYTEARLIYVDDAD